jgi:hypothetical protein
MLEQIWKLISASAKVSYDLFIIRFIVTIVALIALLIIIILPSLYSWVFAIGWLLFFMIVNAKPKPNWRKFIVWSLLVFILIVVPLALLFPSEELSIFHNLNQNEKTDYR